MCYRLNVKHFLPLRVEKDRRKGDPEEAIVHGIVHKSYRNTPHDGRDNAGKMISSKLRENGNGKTDRRIFVRINSEKCPGRRVPVAGEAVIVNKTRARPGFTF